MTGLRRTLLLVLVTAGVFLGVPASAQAAFSDNVTTPAVTVSTVTVQPVTGLSTVGSICRGNTLDLQLSWTKSTTDRVASYRVRMYTNVGINMSLATVSPAATSFDASVSVRVNSRPTTYQFTVTTTTDYGWTTESTRTGAITC